ncbi:uncharacterized protein VTP21DRAFT_3296 [Calcarisporiella thermophila]|uniref:uncharacterized protein n=1 Tax=Calcarisporiella thermophila TaxID=911321 RepID=UPI00374255FF
MKILYFLIFPLLITAQLQDLQERGEHSGGIREFFRSRPIKAMVSYIKELAEQEFQAIEEQELERLKQHLLEDKDVKKAVDFIGRWMSKDDEEDDEKKTKTKKKKKKHFFWSRDEDSSMREYLQQLIDADQRQDSNSLEERGFRDFMTSGKFLKLMEYFEKLSEEGKLHDGVGNGIKIFSDKSFWDKSYNSREETIRNKHSNLNSQGDFVGAIIRNFENKDED